MRRITGVVLVPLVMAGCSSGASSPSSQDGQHLTSTDRSFLAQISHNDKLAAKDATTMTGLGQEACDLLTDYHGDATKVDAFFVKTAGQGGRRFFDAPTMAALRGAATSSYCPKWSQP